MLDRPGLWRRAAFDGTLCGLDLSEALAGLPPGCDRRFAVELLIVAEQAYLFAALTKDR
jgi:hypothetical protein